jgi:hypothetical protein
MRENKRNQNFRLEKEQRNKTQTPPPTKKKKPKKKQNKNNSTPLLKRPPHDQYSNIPANNSSKKGNPSYILIKQ